MRSERLGRSRAGFAFSGERRGTVKVLFFDGTGLSLFCEGLDRGTFRAPEPRGDATTVQRSEREFDELGAGGAKNEGARTEVPGANPGRRA
ncbi:MAG: IS66 family insertion sequence element accessory protein TnpB [Myxococcaceae bacterium]|jgi:transposase|nr:IS66 family insertion sequence element accessory protein TnpB [Myxococcaceae bacterium]MCA3012617.1 IS66 family insertion sequence element accessory protein TnpB [Myxococcaceae bacterium]